MVKVTVARAVASNWQPKMTKKGLIYLAGVVVLGLGYGLLKGMLGDVEFVVAALVYLVGLRLLAEKFGKGSKAGQ